MPNVPNLGVEGSCGIYLEKSFVAPKSATQIWSNQFYLSNPNLDGGPTVGVNSFGDKQHLSIRYNLFRNGALSNEIENSLGIFLRRSNGFNNEVIINSFGVLNSQVSRGLRVFDFSNTNYCSNSFEGSGGVGIEFNGQNFGTIVEGNSFIGKSLIIPTGRIDPQTHLGNHWFSFSQVVNGQNIVLPTFHTSNNSNAPTLSLFTVHTTQSCSSEAPSCFNEFFPSRIFPNNNDFFFSDPAGSPSASCGGDDGLISSDHPDVKIAQSLFSGSSNTPATQWEEKRHLYRKLKFRPLLVNNHPAFGSFLTNQQNTTVGRFHALHNIILTALPSDSSNKVQSNLLQQTTQFLLDSITALNNVTLLNATDSVLHISKLHYFFEQLHLLCISQEAIQTAHDVAFLQKLQNAYDLNQSTLTSTDFEANEKTVTEISLFAKIHQNGKLTDTQISVLQMIATKDSNVDGSSVYEAYSMLPECAKPQNTQFEDIQYFEDEQIIDRNTQHSISTINDIVVTPNPTTSSFSLLVSNNNFSSADLVDLAGNIWLTKPIRGPETVFEFDSNLPAGIYVLFIKKNDGSTLAKKIMIQSN